jgi:hypothetical protein
VNPFIETAKWLIYETTRFVAPTPVAVEWVLVALGALLIAAVPVVVPGSAAKLHGFRTAFHRLANRRRTAILICGLVPVAIRLALLGMMPVPEPSIHDEFSQLLLGDTLAHGRLANAPHPMWRHFESIHIIQQPTYSSMYPPAQGAFLALGEVLFREPWAGVVISLGLMCMAVCWMMQGWLPPAWAFYGSLLVGLKIGIVGLWMNSYLSAAAPAIGGALLIGSLPRLRREGQGIWPSLLFGLGMVILMNSRPFDGALLSIAALLYLFLWGSQSWMQPAFRRPRVLLPAAAVLACGVAFMGYYNWRVTGSPARMPYQVNRDTYGWPENLAFLKPRKLTLRDPVMEKMYLKEVARREVYHHPDKLLDDFLTRLFDSWTYFIGPLLTVPLLFLPWTFRDRRTRPLVFFASAIAVLNLFQLVLYPYHLAPLVGVMFAIVTQGVRHLYVRLGYARGAVLAMLLPVGLLMVAALKQEAGDLNVTLAYWERAFEWHRDVRSYIVEWLSRRPGKQLVVVRYRSFHEVNQEWVYNGADIDGSKIVWAREVSPESDAELLKCFHDREAWLLEADVYPQRVVRYALAQQQDVALSP